MRILPSLISSVVLIFGSLLRADDILVKNGETVAFMGDSITAQGAATPGGYVRLVASGLAAQGVEITVIPAGISGHKSNQMLARLEQDVLSKKPTWMTLSCGVNDVWHGANGVPLEDYKKNITEILDRCQKAGVKVVVLTSTQIQLPVTNANNVKLADYNAFLRDIAKTRNLPLADLNADMLAEQDALKAAGIQRSLTVDGVHMSIYGNLMMAKGVLKAFGLSDRQLKVTEAKWADVPETVQISPKIKLSLKEMNALESYATGQKKSAETLVNELAAAAVKSALDRAAAR